ncbi:MAG: helix-turn-helix transcriptional regulator [Planctomycetia bacterium]|nr:helix-turn-helix transcriptional regulator [Planctomycetia bacterium]
MEVVRKHLKSSEMTYQALGEKMGYPPESARQSVAQFLRGGDPRVGTIRRFAKAFGVPISKLFR